MAEPALSRQALATAGTRRNWAPSALCGGGWTISARRRLDLPSVWLYGSAEMLGWLVDKRGIEPHVKVFDKSERSDGTFSRSDFVIDPDRNLLSAPEAKS